MVRPVYKRSTLQPEVIKKPLTGRLVKEKKLQTGVEALSTILTEQITQGILTITAEGTILFANHFFSKLVGKPLAKIIGSSLYQYLPTKDTLVLQALFKSRKKITIQQVNLLGRAKAIKTVQLSSAIIKKEKKTKVFSLFIQDISQNKKTENALRKKINYISHHDSLTGILNHVAFQENIRYFMKLETFALIKVEFDRFDVTASSLGYEGINKLLRDFVKKLKSINSPNVLSVARIGDYRFGFILDHKGDEKVIIEFAKKILSLVEKPMVIENKEVFITASIGISVFPIDAKDDDGLIKNTEMALVQAKEQGGNYFQFSSPGISLKFTTKHEIENTLREALYQNRFKLFYQPKVDIRKGIVVGVEALLRLQDEHDDFIPPGFLLKIAEETDLIIPIGECVLKQVCEEYFSHKIEIPIAVNLSVRQFKKSYDLNAYINRLKTDYCMPLNQLELEVTETLMMNDPERILKILIPLREQGVKIAIDDFGVGYSSFAYLKNLAPQSVKIDKSFIDGIPYDSTSNSIVRAMILVCRSLGMKSIAEGVERAEQVTFLMEEGCDQIQGFHFARPMPMKDLVEFLKKKISLNYPTEKGGFENEHF